MKAVHKDESPSGQGGGFQKTLQNTSAAILSPAEKLINTQKQLATLRARCALAGVTLHALENDHGKTVYIVSRWALTRELADLESVAAWLKKVTGVRP